MEAMNWQEQAGYESVFQVDDYLYFYGDLLHRAGMGLEQIYSGWDAQPLSTESRRMIIIARK